MIYPNFQAKVYDWMVKCFGDKISNDTIERNWRFLEEALELVQALNMTKEDVLKLVDYTYSRPLGAPIQEVGGVCITLAALTNANNINLEFCAETELTRISQPHIIESIRLKQKSKPKGPLPE